VQLDRIDVVGTQRQLPRSRLRELQLSVALQAAVECLDVVLGHDELILRQHAAR
jgi:hypothetical protein